MDDVLCETARGCLAIIERKFGRRVPYECLTSFDLGQACELGPEETAALYHIVHHPDELLKLDPIPAAIPILRQWSAGGYKVAIVTGRPPATYEPSVQWLNIHEVPYHSFIMVDKYGRFETQDTIAVSLAELAAASWRNPSPRSAKAAGERSSFQSVFDFCASAGAMPIESSRATKSARSDFFRSPARIWCGAGCCRTTRPRSKAPKRPRPSARRLR